MAATAISRKNADVLRERNPFISNIDLVYRLVREDIVEHRLKPGQKLNQEQIADVLEVSRTPVREALNLLERDGFLDKGGQGYSVHEMKIGEYMALLDLRIAIEELAVKLACSRIRISEMKKIEENLVASSKFLEEGLKTAWDEDCNIVNPKKAEQVIYRLGKMDQQFHSIIVGSTHNKFIIQTYEDLQPKIHFFRFTAMDVNCCMNMVERHKMIYDAITRRDEITASQRMETHLRLTVSRAMRY